MAWSWGSTLRASLARFRLAGPQALGGGGQRVLLEARAAQTKHFWENFIKEKLKSTPDLVGKGQVRSSPKLDQGVWHMSKCKTGCTPLDKLGYNLTSMWRWFM